MNQAFINEAFMLFHRDIGRYYMDGRFVADGCDADRMTITAACDIIDRTFGLDEGDATIEIVHVLQKSKPA